MHISKNFLQDPELMQDVKQHMSCWQQQWHNFPVAPPQQFG
jgi:hypothetical protein